MSDQQVPEPPAPSASPEQTLRIAIADDEAEMQEYLKYTLTEFGHEVVSIAGTGAELIEHCKEQKPDLVITDIKMPDIDGLAAADAIRQGEAIPIILVSAHSEPDYIDRALKNHVLAYLIKPIKQADLRTAITLVMQRFKEFQVLQKQADDLRQALEDRKLIERAKGILMKRANLDEPDAFRRLQKISSDKNQKMVEIARMILTAEEAMG